MGEETLSKNGSIVVAGSETQIPGQREPRFALSGSLCSP